MNNEHLYFLSASEKALHFHKASLCLCIYHFRWAQCMRSTNHLDAVLQNRFDALNSTSNKESIKMTCISYQQSKHTHMNTRIRTETNIRQWLRRTLTLCNSTLMGFAISKCFQISDSSITTISFHEMRRKAPFSRIRTLSITFYLIQNKYISQSLTGFKHWIFNAMEYTWHICVLWERIPPQYNVTTTTVYNRNSSIKFVSATKWLAHRIA